MGALWSSPRACLNGVQRRRASPLLNAARKRAQKGRERVKKEEKKNRTLERENRGLP